jgi:predicted transcriptional regulator
MIPIDFRQTTFQALQARLTGFRATVLEALREGGPATTRELAKRMSWDLLAVRPRITELFQMGFVRCLDREGHEGTYEALSGAEARQHFQRMQAEAQGEAAQTELALL